MTGEFSYYTPVGRRSTGARTWLVALLMAIGAGGGWVKHETYTEELAAAQHASERYADLQQHCFERQIDQAGKPRIQP